MKKLEDFKAKYNLMQREMEGKQRIIEDLQRALSNAQGGSITSAGTVEAENNRKLLKQLARAH